MATGSVAFNMSTTTAGSRSGPPRSRARLISTSPAGASPPRTSTTPTRDPGRRLTRNTAPGPTNRRRRATGPGTRCLGSARRFAAPTAAPPQRRPVAGIQLERQPGHGLGRRRHLHGHRPRHGARSTSAGLAPATGGNAGTTPIAFAAGVPSRAFVLPDGQFIGTLTMAASSAADPLRDLPEVIMPGRSGHADGFAATYAANAAATLFLPRPPRPRHASQRPFSLRPPRHGRFTVEQLLVRRRVGGPSAASSRGHTPASRPFLSRGPYEVIASPLVDQVGVDSWWRRADHRLGWTTTCGIRGDLLDAVDPAAPGSRSSTATRTGTASSSAPPAALQATRSPHAPPGSRRSPARGLATGVLHRRPRRPAGWPQAVSSR